MHLNLQLHLVMMSKYSKFGMDTFNPFYVMGYIKVFAQQWQRWKRWQTRDHNSLTFSSKYMSYKSPPNCHRQNLAYLCVNKVNIVYLNDIKPLSDTVVLVIKLLCQKLCNLKSIQKIYIMWTKIKFSYMYFTS